VSEGIKSVVYRSADLASAKAMFSAARFYHVDDIRSTLQTLVDAGAEVDTDVKDVGGGRQIAAVKDADGNLIGLLQDA
jgi:predicted enzyme related to lactoylglutathione lyase